LKNTPFLALAICAKLTVWAPSVVWKVSLPVVPLQLRWAPVWTKSIRKGRLGSLKEPLVFAPNQRRSKETSPAKGGAKWNSP